MLKPFLIVGVGGSGGKTVRALRETLKLRLRQKEWYEGIPKAWQILHVDTPFAQDGKEFPSPFLPAEDYLGLVAGALTYGSVFSSIFSGGQLDPAVRMDMERQLPSPVDCSVDVTAGAGQYRAVGRTIALSRMEAVKRHLEQGYNRMNSGEAQAQLARLSEKLGDSASGGATTPTVMVVSSIAGGSGAGQYIDVTEVLKTIGGPAIWTEQITAILYSPDVFHRIGGKGGVEPNALGAISEAMAGLWSGGVNEVTKKVYEMHGVIPSLQRKTNRVGPTFNYIVGRSNSAGVDFDDQTLTYMAVAQGLSKWMTDGQVQAALSSYSIGNMESAWVAATQAPDFSLLKDTNEQFAPFTSFGFGRVGLGSERFSEYSSDRLARSVIDTMMTAHLEADPFEKERRASEWIMFNAERSIMEFIASMELDEESENANQIIDALRPDNEREALRAEMRSAVTASASGGVDNKGEKSVADWQSSIVFAYEQTVDRLLQQERFARQMKGKTWAAEIQTKVLNSVGRSLSQRGLPVTIELLKRVEEKVSRACAELAAERAQQMSWASQMASYVGQQLGQAAGQANLRADHPVVGAAIEEAASAYYRKGEAELREYAVAMMNDLIANFLRPLRSSLDRGYKDLMERLKGAQGTIYGAWPERDSSDVAPKYRPAPNERLLLDPDQYPEKFDKLIEASVPTGETAGAMRKCIDELVLGNLLEMHVREGEGWDFIEAVVPWVPEEQSARQDATQSQRSAKFEFESSVLEYKERAMRWLRRPDSAFAKYLEQDLKDYLNPEKSGYQQRLTEFRAKFTEALVCSAPLVNLNAQMMESVHSGKVTDVQVTVSTVPFAEKSDVYELVKEVVLERHNDPTNPVFSDTWFNPGIARVQEIDIFTQLKRPVQPMVIDSLMGPINSEWKKSAALPSTRESFLRWKRGRSLSESIPASKARQASMIRGWYVAKTLGHLSASTQEESRGPKVSVWCGEGPVQLEFPHPLMSAEPVQGVDLIGGVLLSLPLALIECNSQRRLDPLFPYHRLMHLDPSAKADGTGELLNWIQNGLLKDQHAPVPNPDRAGSQSMTMEERKQAVLSYLDSQLAEAKEYYFNVDKYQDVRSYTLGWEMRYDIETALSDVRMLVESVRPKVTGV